METKKTDRANLEKTKAMGGMMGLVVALAVLFVGFEWATNMDLEKIVRPYDPQISDTMFPPISYPEPPPPPPPPPPMSAPEILNVIENNEDPGNQGGFTSEPMPGEPTPSFPPPPIDNGGEVSDNEIFIVVEEMPQFPGGEAAMMQFIGKSINYPEQAIEREISGNVVCSFVIGTDGTITDATILKGIDYSLDKEALRVINSMPKWKPGKQRDKAVRVKYTIPIRFRLQK